MIAFFAVILLLVGGVFCFTDKNAIRAVVHVNELVAYLREYEGTIRDKEKSFVLRDYRVALYRPLPPKEEPLPEGQLPVANQSVISPVSPSSFSSAVDLPRQDISSLPSVAVVQERIPVSIPQPKQKELVRGYQNAQHNLMFRLFVWRDLFAELIEKRAIFGFGLGKPLRSKSLEILRWSDGQHNVDGWISGHNSWFFLIYLFGLAGIACIAGILFVWWRMMAAAVRTKNMFGIFLCSALLGWMVGANAQPLFEQPHYAIFIWGLWGISWRQIYERSA